MSPTKSKISDAVERAGWSSGQALFAVLLTTGAISDVRHLQWGLAVGTAVGAFVVSVVATAAVYVSPLTATSFWADLGLRLVKTFLSAFAGALGAGAFDAFAFDWTAPLNIAFLATLAALGKGLLARQETAGADNPSTLPPRIYQQTLPNAKAPELLDTHQSATPAAA